MTSLPIQLNQLENHGLIQPHLREELEYLFRHALVHEATYASILKADRRFLHEQIGGLLEAHWGEQAKAHAAVLAQHFLLAQDTVRALHYCRLAGEQALRCWANTEAEQHFRAGLTLETAATEKPFWLGQVGEALFGQERYIEAIAVWQETCVLLLAQSAVAMAAHWYARMMRAAGPSHLGDVAQALALGQAALAHLRSPTPSAQWGALLHELGRMAYFAGQQASSEAYCEQALALAEQLGDAALRADVLATLWGLVRSQEQAAAKAALLEAATIAEQLEQWQTAARAYHNLGFVVGMTDPNTGYIYLTRAVVLNQQLGQRISMFYTRTAAMLFLYLQANFAQLQRDWAELTSQLQWLPPDHTQVAYLAYWEAILQLVQGQAAVACELLHEQHATWRSRGSHEDMRNCAVTLGEAYLLHPTPDWGAAEAVLTEAVAISEASGTGVDAHGVLVAVYARQQKWEAAQALLVQMQQYMAVTTDPLNATYWAEAVARLAATQGHWAQAGEAYAQAADVYAQRGYAWFQARILYEWAQCERPDLLPQALAAFAALQVPPQSALGR